MYRADELADELTVLPDGPLADRLTEATRHLASVARSRDLAYARRPASTSPVAAAATARAAAGSRPGPAVWDLAWALEGSLVTGDERVGRYVDGRVEPYTPRFEKDLPELRRLVGIRDAAHHVLAVQFGDAADAELASAQAALRSAYDDYVRLYGPLNRSTTARTGRRDRATGDEVTRRVRPRQVVHLDLGGRGPLASFHEGVGRHAGHVVDGGSGDAPVSVAEGRDSDGSIVAVSRSDRARTGRVGSRDGRGGRRQNRRPAGALRFRGRTGLQGQSRHKMY